jgi:uncharacterized membrane protein
MRVKLSPRKSVLKASTKLALAAISGLAVFALAQPHFGWGVAPLLAWDTAAIVFLADTWWSVLHLETTLVKKHALREDPSRVVADTVLLSAAVASLAAVWQVLAGNSSLSHGEQVLRTLLAVASVVLSWFVVHTVYALRYAELYYTSPVGGVEFLDTRTPDYPDFAYLAFTLGMTYQVSDTALARREFRRTALGQAFFSYLFGTVIIATTINLVVGLGR